MFSGHQYVTWSFVDYLEPQRGHFRPQEGHLGFPERQLEGALVAFGMSLRLGEVKKGNREVTWGLLMVPKGFWEVIFGL